MRYRNDREELQSDGARVRYADWIGGPSIAGVANCRINGIDKRYTVSVTGEADTWFSLPGETKIMGLRVTGYLTSDDDRNLYFRLHDDSRAALKARGVAVASEA